MPRHDLLIAASLAAMTACTPPAGRNPPQGFSSANPFAARSTLPFEAPPFDRIRDADYQPAIEEGIRRALAEAEQIAAQDSAPTFANTIEAMERSGELLTRVTKVFFALTQANTNDTLQRVQAEVAPKLAEFSDAVFLNPKLYARVKSLYDRREQLGLTPVQQYLVWRYHRNFVRAGAELPGADQARLKELNKELSVLSTDFQNRLLEADNGGAVVVSDSGELAGLSAGDRSAAAEAAAAQKLAGKWVLTLRNTTQQPALASLTNRALRERLLTAAMTRGAHGDSTDTRALVQKLATLRAEQAKLLGFADYATYALDDQMAGKPEAALKLMTDMVPAATAKARGEAAKMQAIIDHDHGGFKLAAWDWELYAERVRRAEYALDGTEVQQYFELDRVLRDGVFYAATKMYGITFRERKDLPVYHPDVRVFDVLDADGTPLALFYADYFTRPSKSGGAWEDTFVDQSGLLGTHPVAFNVTNFTRPAAGQPALLSFDDVTTMFHEFGHALHSIFAQIPYPTLAGTPSDFVEFPSQFNEHWAMEPSVFANYAKHHVTGAPMPAALVEKIRKARTFNQGYATTEYLAAALLDMAWHTIPAGQPAPDVAAFEADALRQFKVDLPEVPPRYKTPYFSHIWDGGYAAGYYAYLWSEVLDHDAYYWFREHGGMTRENGQRYREMILSRGGTSDLAELYRAFRGRDPVVEPLLEQRGLKTPARY